MGVSITPNWLVIIGLVYAGIGVLLFAGPITFATGRMSPDHERTLVTDSTMSGFGLFLVMAGFFFQGVGQFYAMPLNGFVAAALVGLVSGLSVMALIDLGAAPGHGEPELAVASADVARMAPVERLPVIAAVTEEPPAPVKLVSSV